MDKFEKKHEFLICVDSDGCAMDTMDVKHVKCFGPCMIQEWGLSERKEEVQNEWNRYNLYSMTRGNNRFKALAAVLRYVHQTENIDGIEILEKWVEESPALSNEALKQTIKENDHPVLEKALHWSEMVNKSIDRLPFEEKMPFKGVKEALKAAHAVADIVVVSSANRQAVEEEWDRYGLLESVDRIMAQDEGSKAKCIKALLEYGYEKKNVVMTGDAPGDLKAAKENGVGFYPILVRKESESWQEFYQALEHILRDTFTGEYQEKKIKEFCDNLS